MARPFKSTVNFDSLKELVHQSPHVGWFATVDLAGGGKWTG